MILRYLLSWGVRGRAGVCWGVPRSTQVTPAPRLLSSCCAGPRVIAWPSVKDGRARQLHTNTPSCSAFTWSRRRRKRLDSLGTLTTSHSPYCTDISRRSRGVEEEELKDDEAQQMVPMGIGSSYMDVHAQLNVGDAVIYELERLYDIPKERAVRMVRADNFLLVSDKAILKTLYFLKDHQVSSEQLQRIPWLMLQPTDVLQEKFDKLVGPHLFLNLPDGLGFAFYSLQTIQRLQGRFAKEAHHFQHHPNRVYYLAHRLQMPIALVTEKSVKPKQVLTLDIKKINIILDIFEKYNVQMASVVSDLWVFCHNLGMIEDRLRQATEAGCTRPKPWICHAAPPVFEKYIERVKARRQVLGEHGSPEAYLSERLQCPLHEIQAAFRRNKGLSTIHVGHMKTKLDLILDAGFTTDDIRGCMRVLQYSVERTQSRIEEMKSLGHYPFSISILFKQPKTYTNIVHRIKRKKKEAMLKREEEGDGGGREGG